MAASAMRVLADPKGRSQVRSEAARALGFMQITNAVSNYNYPLVAYAVGMLAADLGELQGYIDDMLARVSEFLTDLNALETKVRRICNDGNR